MTARSRRSARPPGDPVMQPRALSLEETCQRLGISKRTGEHLIAEGRFPIPGLPSLGLRRHRFSSATLDAYLTTADMESSHG